MWPGTPLFPDTASTMAHRVDALYFFLIGLTAFFSLLIAGLIIYYAIKFRRRAPDSVGARLSGGLVLEITWTVIPFLITIFMFVDGARVFLAAHRPPDSAMEIFVIGKQWMWKVQHPEGRREGHGMAQEPAPGCRQAEGHVWNRRGRNRLQCVHAGVEC